MTDEERRDAGQAVADLVTMRVADVRRVPTSEDGPDQWAMMLEEVGGDRRLMIWVGMPEALALALNLQRTSTPRPMSYQFMAGLLEAAGGRLREVRVDRLSEGTFYATAIVEAAAGPAEVDARPSDALNLAQVTGVPIKVAETVLTAAEATVHRAPGDVNAPDAVGAVVIIERFQQEHERAMAAWHARCAEGPDEPPAGQPPTG